MKLTSINKPVIALAALVSIVGAYAQSGGHAQHHTKTAPQTKTQMRAGMAMPMADMDMAKCMADMKAGAAKLADLAAMMNSCKGLDKIDATAGVVNEMLAEQKKCDAMCMQMMSHMGD